MASNALFAAASVSGTLDWWARSFVTALRPTCTLASCDAKYERMSERARGRTDRRADGGVCRQSGICLHWQLAGLCAQSLRSLWWFKI